MGLIVWIVLLIISSDTSKSLLPKKLLKIARTRFDTSIGQLIDNERVDEVRKVVQLFGKSTLKLAVVKERRHRNATAVCDPEVFKGALFMERESQMKQLDSLLFNKKNPKQKRNLIAAVASSGMGKSAFVDEYCQKLLVANANKDIFPIAITFNTKTFGGSSRDKNCETSTDLAARLLMSYFLKNPSIGTLETIYDLLLESGGGFEILRAVAFCIQDDLRTQYGVANPRILVACDEVGKSVNEKGVVSILCSLIDNDNDLEVFFTGLTLNPFDRESSSGRFIENVPLPLLTFTASLALVQSFICGSDSSQVSSKLARLSGGHPRTLQVFEDIIRNHTWNALKWNDTMFETVVNSACKDVIEGNLKEEEIMLLLRSKITINDTKMNAVLTKALETGKLYATLSTPDDEYVELFTSPMLLRSSVLNQLTFSKSNLISYLNELLNLVGLRDLKEFRTANGQRDGKFFESFYLNMELFRRSLQKHEMATASTTTTPILNFYPSVTYSQNCNIVRMILEKRYAVEKINCKYDFPSNNSADVASITLVKTMIDNVETDKVIYPAKRDQAAYDFFFILKDFRTGRRFLQLMEPTFSAGTSKTNQTINDLHFINRVVDKLEKSEKLAWSELGVGVGDTIHTFVSTGNTSQVDWKGELARKGLSHRRVLILDLVDLLRFYGPMMNVLLSCSLDG